MLEHEKQGEPVAPDFVAASSPTSSCPVRPGPGHCGLLRETHRPSRAPTAPLECFQSRRGEWLSGVPRPKGPRVPVLPPAWWARASRQSRGRERHRGSPKSLLSAWGRPEHAGHRASHPADKSARSDSLDERAFLLGLSATRKGAPQLQRRGTPASALHTQPSRVEIFRPRTLMLELKTFEALARAGITTVVCKSYREAGVRRVGRKCSISETRSRRSVRGSVNV
jgi:hypothetical protein